MIPIKLFHSSFAVNLLHIYKTTFLKNTSEGLLLLISINDIKYFTNTIVTSYKLPILTVLLLPERWSLFPLTIHQSYVCPVMWGAVKCYILESFIFGFLETQTCCMHPIITLFPSLVFMIATNPGYISFKWGFSHYEAWSYHLLIGSWQTWSPHFFAITFF